MNIEEIQKQIQIAIRSFDVAMISIYPNLLHDEDRRERDSARECFINELLNATSDRIMRHLQDSIS